MKKMNKWEESLCFWDPCTHEPRFSVEADVPDFEFAFYLSNHRDDTLLLSDLFML